MYKNYIFDLYGTLLDVRTDEYSKNFFKKYAKWLRRQGFTFEWKKFYRMYTDTERRYRENAAMISPHRNPEIQIEEVFREIFSHEGYDLDDGKIMYLCENFRMVSLIYLRLFPDTIECLERLRSAGKRIYLLSNAQRSFTWRELEMTGLTGRFDGILISSDEGCMKPDTDFFDICCDRYKLDKHETIMIGNELKSDMAGANAAGIDGFYINRAPVMKMDGEVNCRFVSKTGSLMDIIEKTL